MRIAQELLAVAALGHCLAAVAANDWENPAVNSIDRLPARTYSMPLASEADALTDALEPETPYKLSLNGEWKYSWAGNPDLRAKGFERTDYDDSSWFTIDVPSCVELRGFGSPGYVNVRYPHADLSHPTNAAFAAIRDRQSGRADYNPVSSYRRTFTVPESWKGRDVILRFDGVYSAYYVWVNGQRVGYAEDSKLPSEFNITPYLNHSTSQPSQPSQPLNLLCVEVYRWCDGSYLEDQDMTRYSGIFRDVTLWAKPKDGIWDFAVRTRPLDGYESWSIELELENGGSASLYDADKQKVCDLHPTTTPNIYASTLAARAWSAEKPYLYTLVLKKGDDIRMKRIGFKEQKVVGHTVLVNGQKVKFKGVNRHETSPENGRAITLADMIRDVTLMKRYNINTVRTSHYPDHHLWYDLCDRYGIYLCAEANVEGHEPGYDERGLGRFPEWEHTIVERNLRHVTFYRNHPSVTLWSMGNETGHGDCFRHAIAAVRALDPTRIIHWERGNPDADVDSRMYPSVDWLEKRGQMGDGLSVDATEDKYHQDANRQTPNKAFFMCEYAHAMGNAIGDFDDYWTVFYRHDSLSGGCIWDWIDQAVWKPTGRIGADGKPERFLSYGGDFDEQPNDGPFNCNGVIDPERHVTAKLVEVGHVHRNLVVTRSESPDDNGFATVFELWNRFCFTQADEFDAVWMLRENGKVTKTGGFEPPALKPLSRCRFTVPGLAEALAASAPGAELFVDFEFSTKADCAWAKKGWVVARDQVGLGKCGNMGVWKWGNEEEGKCESVKIGEDEKTVTAECGGTKAVFCRRSGTLCELVMNGKTVLKDPAPGIVTGPELTCMRALTDNDVWIRGRSLEDGPLYLSGLTQLRHHARPIVVKDGQVVVTVEVTGSKSAGFTHEATWSFATDGAIRVANRVVPHGTMPDVLPRLGLTLRLNKAFDRVEYYGRGPRENYIDRKTASFLGLWRTTVDGLGEFYVRPQDNGFRSDIRWVSFTDASGAGVRFSASEPLFVQALRNGWEDLEFSRQRRGQQRFRTPVVPRDEIFVNLDIRQLGLGGASCGPGPQVKNRFPIREENWTVRIEPCYRNKTEGKGK